VFVEEEEQEEDDAVEELLAGEFPLLVGGDADGEDHHEEGSGDEGDAGEDAQDEGEAENGFDERDGVAEGVDDAGREWGFGEMLGGGLGEGCGSVVDADQAVAGEVDAEGYAEERVGKGFVRESHSYLRRAAHEWSSISVIRWRIFSGRVYCEP
jgi:hypothetical protein